MTSNLFVVSTGLLLTDKVIVTVSPAPVIQQLSLYVAVERELVCPRLFPFLYRYLSVVLFILKLAMDKVFDCPFTRMLETVTST